MATREENIKKINDELEKMSEEELDQVSGGNYAQTTADQTFLYEHGLGSKAGDEFDTFVNWKDVSKMVNDAWSKAGITAVTKSLYGNEYFVNGQKISREEAMKIVEEKFPKIR